MQAGGTMGMAQNSRARVMQVLVFGFIYQVAILVHVFVPLPNGSSMSKGFKPMTGLDASRAGRGEFSGL